MLRLKIKNTIEYKFKKYSYRNGFYWEKMKKKIKWDICKEELESSKTITQ